MSGYFDLMYIRVVEADFDTFGKQLLDNMKRRRFTQIVHVFFVGHPEHEHFALIKWFLG
ncbi:hypothetical protein D3C76_1717800 [compost metagenome]